MPNNYTCSKCGKYLPFYPPHHTCVGPSSELEEVANEPWWSGLAPDQLADDPRSERGDGDLTSNRPSYRTCLASLLVPVIVIIAALIINYFLW